MADHFTSVTIIERDQLPDAPGPRKGVPQSRQTHAILERGAQIIAGFFPGFWEEMLVEGSVPLDSGQDMAWFHHGAWKARLAGGPTTYGQSRTLLEFHVRRRLLKDCAHVRVLRGDVAGLLHDATNQQITGVRVNGEDGNVAPLEAELVVDASGRGTRAPRWLEELGYGRPPMAQVRIDVCYASRIVEPPPGARDWKAMMVYGKAPHEKRMGFIFPIEGGRWNLTVAGYHGDHPTADEEGFLEFARSVHHPDYFAAMQDARPISPIAMHKVPTDQRYYYERMARFPDGFITVGDAICSFNPLFGQGMTTASLGALTLSECLAERAPGQGKGLSRDFQKRTTRYNDAAWAQVTGEDFRFSETEGERPPMIKVLHWYTRQIMELCSVDASVQRRMLPVTHMQAGMEVILSPSMMVKALMWGVGLRGNRALVVSHPPPIRFQSPPNEVRVAGA
ncbi:hypothetical protein SYV04_00240 [Hyalangium sp. s54d21]|uniref:Uncharacterized protein n=1 Tax=Hyalangium rubrum TaxID=3103134 RepID=A0ABU5GV55_9BACT|nr:hypothetical protein [Hyalangium sp. s54d21]MDY7224782.1 hypothetical protein [Hyalangium sp. s54d21]